MEGTYGLLTVIRCVGSNREWRKLYECKCACGNKCIVSGRHLRSGHTKSCGCLRHMVSAQASERGRRYRRHGACINYKVTPAYRSWLGMRQRCTNPKDRRYSDYGGRGITICERWRKFENFLADMGERPANTSIDRIDNDGNYEPGNCRWATASEQASNRKRIRQPQRSTN